MNKDTKKKNANPEADKKKVTKAVDKESLKDISDEELNKAAGGLWCEPGCEPILNGCYCDEESDW